MPDENVLTGADTPESGAADSVNTTPEGVETDAVKQGESADASGAPEAYDFKAPEGAALDPVAVTAFSEVAKELSLSQEAAQKIIDKMAPALAARQLEAMHQLAESWKEQSKADKEFGGEALDANLAVARRGLEAFGSPELRKLLHESGMGNHPEVIRAFYRVGKLIAEDGKPVTGSPPGERQPLEKRLYSKSNMN